VNRRDRPRRLCPGLSVHPAIHSVGLLHRQLLRLAADSGPHGSVNGASPPSGITAQRRQPEGRTVIIEKIRRLDSVAALQHVSRLRFTKMAGTVNGSGFKTLPVHVQPVIAERLRIVLLILTEQLCGQIIARII